MRIRLWILAFSMLTCSLVAVTDGIAQSIMEEESCRARNCYEVVVLPTARGGESAQSTPAEAATEAVQDALVGVVIDGRKVEHVSLSSARLDAAEGANAAGIRFGRRLYRAGEFEAAETEIQGAVARALAVPMSPSMRELVEQGLETLIFMYLELETEQPTSDLAPLRARAEDAAKQLIAVSPDYEMDPARVPPVVLQRIEDGRLAWLQRLLSDAVPTEAVPLAALANEGVDYVVLPIWARTGGEDVWRVVITRVHDAEVVVDTRVQAGSHAGGAIGYFTGVVTEYFDSLPTKPDEGGDPATRLPHWWLEAGYASGTFLTTPTRRRFVMHGVAFRGEAQLTDVLGVHLSVITLSSIEDRFGDLLDRVTDIRLAGGLGFSHSWDRVRLMFQPGLSFSRVTRVRATESFWCKVSGGDVRTFDGEGRECEASDITNQAPRSYVGLQLDGGIGIKLADPVWITLRVHSILVLALEVERQLDFPIGGEVGLAFRL